MISFFRKNTGDRSTVYLVRHTSPLEPSDTEALVWLFGGAEPTNEKDLTGIYVGPRPEMVTPWSTNATEITGIMGLKEKLGIDRIEAFVEADEETPFDKMLLRKYRGLGSHSLDLNKDGREAVLSVRDIRSYSESEGLALSDEEIEYLEGVAKEIDRPLTDAELFGFSQVNSEHCRHKIFNGTFVLDGKEQERSLFQIIKSTSKANPNGLVSAYKDNVAFNAGPVVEFFNPLRADTSDFFAPHDEKSVLSLKAETHNFPTTVEPFNGAATGSGGEIRDRLGGGRASLPLAGTAVYMTGYPRLSKETTWEDAITARPWLYQTPQEILTKASNGASDFGNKFGQPLISGSLLTFEHAEEGRIWGYDKVIMLAGGIGIARDRDAKKGSATPGDKIVVMGGDNYRIGMGGGAVSSVNTGQYQNAIELNAIQRSNPEMQKRVANVIRALSEGENNPVVSIHDHGAGGHLNCLSELVEETGGVIEIDKLPIGDPTLSDKEIISNESQERMGLLLHPEDIPMIEKIADRERAPFYVVGEATGRGELTFARDGADKPFDLKLEHLFGSAPKTVMVDETKPQKFNAPSSEDLGTLSFETCLKNVLSTETVGSKDWLTNKVDRSVTGKVARQQCQGPLQLPLSDCGAVALDFSGEKGIATSIGHAPLTALIDSEKGSRIAIAEALTNLAGAPLAKGLKSVSLSANWMWPCHNPGEDVRLYKAVEACADFAIALGINIPTGKDSLSMTQKYPDGTKVLAPGTLIVSAAGEVSDVRKVVSPVLKETEGTSVLYIDLTFEASKLGGSVLYQTLGKVGGEVPDVRDTEYFVNAFEAVQRMISAGDVLAIHDISAGGIITALLEMAFAHTSCGLRVSDDFLSLSTDRISLFFSENPGLLIQVKDADRVIESLEKDGIASVRLAEPVFGSDQLVIGKDTFSIPSLREAWYTPSKAMEPFQTAADVARERAKNIFSQPLQYRFNSDHTGRLDVPRRHERSGITAAIIRDKGTNGEREMAYLLYLAGFDVKDVHMTDLISGRETLEEVRMIVFCGGFSHSDVLGSAKGWAAGFRYNAKAREALDKFYARPDTLSLGVCNGCQLMAELGLLYSDREKRHTMEHNLSGKFESGFVTIEIPENNSVMLSSLAGTKLGCWVAHGEGRFDFKEKSDAVSVAAKYAYDAYPGNPNGSPLGTAALTSKDGRHLAIMPHPERSIFPWQCGCYPENGDEVTPWFTAFRNAFLWCQTH